ncbi:MAG: G-D-S-L family lipolytic protein, partial [Clostridia bacterium]|nr:G-D-S-L family lipolytic protein [Clostridia bacterium]
MEIIKPGMFGKNVAADNLRTQFDFFNEQVLYSGRKPYAVFVGDSITMQWDLYTYFKTDKLLVNRGIGGDESKYVLLRFDADCIQLKPEKAILMIGTNDIFRSEDDVWWRSTAGETPDEVLEDYKNNIRGMVKKCDDAGIELILCSVLPSTIAPPFHREMRWEMAAKMNEFLKTLGKTYIDYVSLLSPDGKNLPEDLTPDGVHPNAKCYTLMAEELKRR